ncbi:unnamed protein product [Chrysoparadoxa australica]
MGGLLFRGEGSASSLEEEQQQGDAAAPDLFVPDGEEVLPHQPAPYAVPYKKFHQLYQVGEKLGSGAFSVVHACRHTLTNEEFAVKIVNRGHLLAEDRAALKKEVEIMNEISHPHLVQLKTVFIEEDMVYIVMELVRGGELLSRIVQRTCYTEIMARDLMRLLLMALHYLHSHDIVHRDMKPENLLLVGRDDDCLVKIADFGFAEHISNLRNVDSGCGTPQYVAPEILQGNRCTEKVDVWSVGITLYVLIGGYPPFYARDTRDLYQKVTNVSPWLHPIYIPSLFCSVSHSSCR